MESTVPINSKWLDNRLNIVNVNTIDTTSGNGIESHFVSVKQEAEFLDENLCPESGVISNNTNQPLIKLRNNRNNRPDSLANNQTAIVNSDFETMNRIVESESTEGEENEDSMSERINSRCQVDLIDMRNEQFMEYKYIFVCEDQTTKFVVLRPLRSKDAKDVAAELFDIFAIIGAPRILQCGNGRELANEIVHELRSLWADLVIVHGEVVPRSSKVKRNFEQLLKTWLIDNPGKTWCEGLRFVQIIQNSMVQSEFDKTPYELMFVNNDNALKPLSIKKQAMNAVWCEEDYKKLIKNQKENDGINRETANSRLFDNNYSDKGINSDSVSQIDENLPVKEDGNDERGIEFGTRTRHSMNQENSGGFKFVNVKNESPLHVTQADDSQSESEANENGNPKTRPRDKYQLKCKICQKRYMKLGHLKNHLKAHTKADGFECTICSKKFRLLTVYEKHMRRFHSSDKNPTSEVKAALESDTEDSLKLKRLSEVEMKTDDADTPQKKEASKVGRRVTRPGGKKLSKENRATRFNGSPLLECSYCQQKFDFPSVLKRHVRSHTNERPYVCQICNKSFKQLGHLSQHSLTHTDYRSFQCASCGIKFESLDSLKIHSQSHRGDTVMYRPKEVYRLFECDNCKKVFTTKSVLERHIFTHTHERQFGCKVCGKRFKQAGHVKSHMLVHTGERKFECKVCSKRFSLSNSLKKHMYIHNGEKPYQCDVCGARFLEKRNLNGHLMTHTNERPFSCNICGKRYTLADTLRRHVSAAHEDGRTYQCEICAKMFKQLAHLYVHKKVHTDERPYQCHLCDKNFKHKNVLKSHLAIHANLRPFECDVCKATFVRKTNLQTHIASAHMNERPYVCTICNKRFKQVSHLNGHVVVHSNSMPYQCDFCDRRCNRLDNLKKHMRLHTKSKE